MLEDVRHFIFLGNVIEPAVASGAAVIADPPDGIYRCKYRDMKTDNYQKYNEALEWHNPKTDIESGVEERWGQERGDQDELDRLAHVSAKGLRIVAKLAFSILVDSAGAARVGKSPVSFSKTEAKPHESKV